MFINYAAKIQFDSCQKNITKKKVIMEIFKESEKKTAILNSHSGKFLFCI